MFTSKSFAGMQEWKICKTHSTSSTVTKVNHDEPELLFQKTNTFYNLTIARYNEHIRQKLEKLALAWKRYLEVFYQKNANVT